MKNINIEIGPKSILLVGAFLLLCWISWKSINVILLLFASFTISSSLYPIVEWMSKKMPRSLAILIVYIVGFLVLSTIFVPFVSVVVEQTNEFLKQIPVYFKEIDNLLLNAQQPSNQKLIFLSKIYDFSDIATDLTKLGQDLLSRSINITLNVFAGFITAFTLATMVLFMLLDKESLKNDFLSFFPQDKRKQAEEISKTIANKVGGYFRGQLMVMFAVGLITALSLKLIGLEFALLLGIVAGVLEIIPIVGPILAAVPAIIIALVADPWLALATLVVYLVIQRLENAFLSPMILGKFLDMNPLLIILAILIAANTMGVAGVILSPAILASLYVLVQELYLKKIDTSEEISR